MSQKESDEPRIQDIIDAVRMSIKSRIPRSLHTERREMVNKTKANSSVVIPRPRSTSRGRTDKLPTNDATRSVRSDRDRPSLGFKKSPATKRAVSENQRSKVGPPVIKVPVQHAKDATNKKTVKTLYSTRNSRVLPDQETINQYEELEMQQSNQSYDLLGYDLSENEPDKKPVQDILFEWKKKNNDFQRMKNDLNNRQRSILDFYASLSAIHQKMIAAGHHANLPSTEDLHIMNVAKMTPDQLLKLCAESSKQKNKFHGKIPSKNGLIVDINKLYNMPSKLVSTCEQTLAKRKEMIDWLDSLKSQQVSNQSLTKKIKQYNSENEMFSIALNDLREKCMQELQEVEQYMRQSVNDTMAMHLQSENLTYKLSELNSQNADLRKQVRDAENLRSSSNKNKIMELEKELREKQKSFKERLSKAEGQVRSSKDRTAQLEAALAKVNQQFESKDVTIKELQDQNERLRRNTDEELKRLNESVIANTANLEQIVRDRQKLQNERDELEKKLGELSMYYNESLNNSKKELIANITKLTDTETKYNNVMEEKQKLESYYKQKLLDAESRTKELLEKLEETESYLANAKDLDLKYNIKENELKDSRLEVENCKCLIKQEKEIISEMENNLKTNQEERENLIRELKEQQECNTELKNQEVSLTFRLRDSEAKMEYYQKELQLLNSRIAQLQEQFGEMDDIKVRHETVNIQKQELQYATNRNNELLKVIKKHEDTIMEISDINKTQENELQEKEDIIKGLLKTKDEQCTIIQHLRNDLEFQSNTDSMVSQQLEKKDIEIDSLINNLETRKQQILQLEKIILTLEDKICKATLLRRKCEKKIHLLETKIEIYESFHHKQSAKSSSNNLNQFLKLLEEEMETPIESRDIETERNKNIRNENKDRAHENQSNDLPSFDKYSSKILNQETFITSTNHDGNESSTKKNFVPLNNALFKTDNINCKYDKADVNIYTLEPDTNQDLKNCTNADISHEKILTKNIQVLMRNRYQNEKKAKMFVLAGHKL